MGTGGTSERAQRLRLVSLPASLMVVLSLGLAGCTYAGAPSQAEQAAAAVPTPPVSSATARPPLSGETVRDSFGNVDFYTTVAGDTLPAVAAAYKLSEAKVAAFNGLQPGTRLTPGTRLRLIPPGPTPGAKGAATLDANGIQTSYTIEPDDSLAGITYRFNLTEEQSAEANKVPFAYERGNVFFIQAGKVLQLQKKPVGSRSGGGTEVKNSFGQTVYYTTVDGDSFDSLGYKYRSTTTQILLYNPSLSADQPIPAGTKVRLIPGELKIEGARGTFTTDDQGIPLTYTTAPGDIELQVAFRFGVNQLRSANRPSTGTAGAWYDFTDLPSGELAPGQTISVALDKPINKPGS